MNNNEKKQDRAQFLVKNSIIFSISSIGTKFLSLILVPLYTTYLTSEEYGIIDLISTTRSLMTYVLTFCVADGVLRYVMEQNEKKKKILTYGAEVTVVATMILLGGVTLIRILRIPFIWNSDYDCFFIVLFCTTALNSLYSNYLRA